MPSGGFGSCGGRVTNPKSHSQKLKKITFEKKCVGGKKKSRAKIRKGKWQSKGFPSYETFILAKKNGFNNYEDFLEANKKEDFEDKEPEKEPSITLCKTDNSENSVVVVFSTLDRHFRQLYYRFCKL